MDYDNIVFGMFGSRENYERSIKALVDFAEIQPHESVLEVCCGTGISTRIVMNHVSPGRLTAVELNRERMETARQRLPSGVDLLERDARELQYRRDGIYNVVLCINGFPYFERPEEFYAMAEEMIWPTGRLVFNVKLQDYNGVRPIHNALGEAAYRIAKDIGLIDGSYNYGHDPGFLETAHTQENFHVPYPFEITRKTVFPLFLEGHAVVDYWAGLFFETTREEVMYENEIVTREKTEYIWFKERFYQYIDSIPKEKRLLKAELFVEAVLSSAHTGLM